MKSKGFSLIELIIGMGILMIVFSVVFTTYLTAHRLWRGGFTQITFQSRGRIILAKIARDLRSSTGATVLNNGDRVRFMTDPDRTPETVADDVTSEYYVSNTDIIYDPDIQVPGDEVTLLGNAYQESTIPIFQISGDLVVVTFRLFSSDAVYGTHWSSMTTSVKMRNV